MGAAIATAMIHTIMDFFAIAPDYVPLVESLSTTAAAATTTATTIPAVELTTRL
jgi:hypothetical protein